LSEPTAGSGQVRQGGPRGFAPRCLSIDLEVGKTDGRIHRLAAVRGDSGEALVCTGVELAKNPERLDTFAEGAVFLLGHNLIAFDLPYLQAQLPGLRLLGLPAVDTLRLNPLAFPRNPYHHLVKHYQDGQLRSGRINDPELDARLTLDLFGEQRAALRGLIQPSSARLDHAGVSPSSPALLPGLRPPHPTLSQGGEGSLELVGEGSNSPLPQGEGLGVRVKRMDTGIALDSGCPSEEPRLMPTAPGLLAAWHGLLPQEGERAGLDAFFMSIRSARRPDAEATRRAVAEFLAPLACATRTRRLLDEDLARPDAAWVLAYALAWLSVAGGNSVLPPWVLYQFPDTTRLLAELRDRACDDPGCAWCAEHHDPRRVLKNWFGFDAFRPEPADAQGRSLQGEIVAAVLRGEHVLGILPTGTGKSVCYQVPALSRHYNTGALTVVISPLQALMADQVAGLKRRGIAQCETLNGLLSMPERAEVLDRVRLGDAGILIVSPEQLRNRSSRRAIAQREIGAWVLDEAHCLSKWGHDFRPDYRYVGRFIREQAGGRPIPPVLCLTATAKPEVVAEIHGYFKEKLGIELARFEGGHERGNLDFLVIPISAAGKAAHIHQVLEQYLGREGPGGAIVYAATRRNAEEIAEFLRAQGWSAGYYHAGLTPERKKTAQEAFIAGELRVIAATNAFGMGIDKPDVRLVVHADIPGSLENYLQEAGRAGRDQGRARCVLLYTAEDVERQFGMSARSRLGQRDIQAVLRAIRTLERKNRKHADGEVVATPGEILVEDPRGEFERDRATDDTRVKTAVAWLEEAELLRREENRVAIFPASLKVGSLDEARRTIKDRVPQEARRTELLALVETLLESDADEGVSTDDLMLAARLGPEAVRVALHDLEAMGLVSNDLALTAFVHRGVADGSFQRLRAAVAVEQDLIGLLRQSAPDLQPGETAPLHLCQIAQRLRDDGHPEAIPMRIRALLQGLARDGAGEEGGAGGSLELLRGPDPEVVLLRLRRPWHDLADLAQRHRAAAGLLLDHLLACLPEEARGKDLLAETTQGALMAALRADLTLQSSHWSHLLDRGLLWLHEQEAIRLNRGLTVFRPAMTLHLAPERRGFLKADFRPLHLHYLEQVFQIHVMSQYAERGLTAMADALGLVAGYFTLGKEEFVRRFLPDRQAELARQTTPESWQAIVDALNNREQQRIVADDREDRNLLVLAGPGSGKTRVLVHRIAYLVRCRRENPHGIVALAYNRHTAADIRRRLWQLLGDDAAGVTVLTCHALAMRLVGASFLERRGGAAETDFDAVMEEAVRLLQGGGQSAEQAEEADERRDRLLAGYRWLMVDEYQDIDAGQYALISALAGRTLQDPERRLGLFAVGDDDQNIYAWNGASVEFIRRFQADYAAEPVYLTENYRSTLNLIEAANRVIGAARQRMKAAHPIRIARAHGQAPAGGRWEELDPVARGRVQILSAGPDERSQAQAVMLELTRLSELDPQWDWRRVAVIARNWSALDPVRAWCELTGLPVQAANEATIPFWRLRETQTLVEWLRRPGLVWVTGEELAAWRDAAPDGPWWAVLKTALDEYLAETGGLSLPPQHLLEWLAEYGREMRRQRQGLLLTTAHSAKGLEFDHVALLDGDWAHRGAQEDADSPRRLYYVAMTRARQTLLLAHQTEGAMDAVPAAGRRLATPFSSHGGNRFLSDLPGAEGVLVRDPVPLNPPAPELGRRYLTLALKDIDLGYAGRHAPDHPIHRALADLQPGDPLDLHEEGQRWFLLDGSGIKIARLAAASPPPPRMRFVQGHVAAVLHQSKDRCDPEWHHTLLCDTWEVALPELVFAPVG